MTSLFAWMFENHSQILKRHQVAKYILRQLKKIVAAQLPAGEYTIRKLNG